MDLKSSKGFWDDEPSTVEKTESENSENKKSESENKPNNYELPTQNQTDEKKQLKSCKSIKKSENDSIKKPSANEEKKTDAEFQPEQELLKKKNKKDMIIIISVVAALIIGILAGTVFLYNSGNRKIYSYIDSGSYAVAFKEIRELHESGENVDSLVMEFVKSCMEQKEYRRAVFAVPLLSDEGLSQNSDYLNEAVRQMTDDGDTKQAEELNSLINKTK